MGREAGMRVWEENRSVLTHVGVALLEHTTKYEQLSRRQAFKDV